MKSVARAGIFFFTGIIILYVCYDLGYNGKIGLNTYWIFTEKGK